jgi:hypothetical protein
MKFNMLSTGYRGCTKVGFYTIDGEKYVVTGVLRGSWDWTLTHDKSHHNNLRDLKKHLLTLVQS